MVIHGDRMETNLAIVPDNHLMDYLAKSPSLGAEVWPHAMLHQSFSPWEKYTVVALVCFFSVHLSSFTQLIFDDFLTKSLNGLNLQRIFPTFDQKISKMSKSCRFRGSQRIPAHRTPRPTSSTMSGMQPLAEWRRSHFFWKNHPIFWGKNTIFWGNTIVLSVWTAFHKSRSWQNDANRWISTIIFRRSWEHFTSCVALGSCGSPLQQSWRQTPVTPNSFRKFLVESSKYDWQIRMFFFFFMGLQNAKMRCFSARIRMQEQLLKDGAAVEAVDASTNPVHSVRNKWMNPEELDEWSDNNYINHSVNQYVPTIFHC